MVIGIFVAMHEGEKKMRMKKKPELISYIFIFFRMRKESYAGI